MHFLIFLSAVGQMGGISENWPGAIRVSGVDVDDTFRVNEPPGALGGWRKLTLRDDFGVRAVVDRGGRRGPPGLELDVMLRVRLVIEYVRDDRGRIVERKVIGIAARTSLRAVSGREWRDGAGSIPVQSYDPRQVYAIPLQDVSPVSFPGFDWSGAVMHVTGLQPYTGRR